MSNLVLGNTRLKVGHVIHFQPPPRLSASKHTNYRRIWDWTTWPDYLLSERLQDVFTKKMELISADGSLNDGHGETGRELAIHTCQLSSDEVQQGEAPVDCNSDEQSSTQCELIIILVGLVAVERVTLRRARGTIMAICNSAAALTGIRKWNRHWNTT